MSKRSYLLDLKPFSFLYSPLNIFTQSLNAVVVTSVVVLEDYNQFNKRKEEEDRVESRYISNSRLSSRDDEFDWEDAWYKQYPMFKKSLLKFFSVSTISRILEWLSVNRLLTARIADKLVKDVGKSLTRKLARMPKDAACFKIVKSHMFSSAIAAYSFFVFDSLDKLYELYYNEQYVYISEKTKVYLKWLVKKMALSGVAFAATSLGYGIFSYWNKNLAGVGGLLLGSIINITGGIALGLTV